MPQDGLAHVLRHLQLPRNERVIVGAETADDAGVYRLTDEIALVQTLDFFPPLLDDPYDFGRVAATNALSDVYAMGGEPLTALNIVGFPDKELDPEILLDILRGGADVCRDAGVVVLGGHSVRDAEVKFGMSVTGRVHPAKVWTNAGARVGDRLILTKPIGSGVLTSAAKQDRVSGDDLAEVVSVMSTLNRGAARAAAASNVHACTDITGFGLLGHAAEMASGGGCTVVIDAAAVPLMRLVLDLARAGVLTRAHRSTEAHLGQRLRVASAIERALVGVLLDAQTSGGLLLSVPEREVDGLLARLRDEQTPCAAVIGHVAAASDVWVELR